MKKGLKNIVKNGLASLLAIPVLSIGCGSPKHNNNCEEPMIEYITPQQAVVGDSITIPLNIENSSLKDKVYVNDPEFIVQKNKNDFELKWKPCGYSDYSAEKTAEVTVKNSCGKDSQIINLKILPRIEKKYFSANPDINLVIGDTIRVPLNTISEDPNIKYNLVNIPDWVILNDKELFLEPYLTYDDKLNVSATDGCYSELQKINTKVDPILFDDRYYNLLRDYLKKLNIEDKTTNEKEGGYLLIREVGYGLTDQELNNMFPGFEDIISNNLIITQSHSPVKPVSIHIEEDTTCIPQLNKMGYVLTRNICSFLKGNIYRTIKHEDIHIRLYNKIPNHKKYSYLDSKVNGEVQEPWAYVIGELAIYDYSTLNDFPENVKTAPVYKFIFELYSNYGGDGLNTKITDFKDIFALIDEKSDFGNNPLDLINYKCKVLDTYFKQDTSPVFCSNFTCSSDPRYNGIYDIPRTYCGD